MSEKKETQSETTVSGQMELRARVAAFCPPILFVIRKPKNEPFSYYRENAGGYTASLGDAWKVTEEQGREHTLYADAEPGSDVYYERVILEPAPVPDYPNDLNACAEFENSVLKKDVSLYINYAVNLEAECGGGSIDAHFATAMERCRAFVKTMEAASVHGGDESSSASSSPKSASAAVTPTKGTN